MLVPRKKTTKIKWNSEEKKTVQKELGKFLNTMKVPGKQDCEKCLKKNACLYRRSWKDIKYYVHNTITSMKRKYRFTDG